MLLLAASVTAVNVAVVPEAPNVVYKVVSKAFKSFVSCAVILS